MAKLFREDVPRRILTKRNIVISAVSLLIIAVAVTAYVVVSKQVAQQVNVAFTIEGKAYSKNEVTSLVKYSTQRGVDKETASKQAFEYLKRQAAAKKAGINISDSQITVARDFLFPKNKTAYDLDGSPWIELASYNEALTRVFTSNKVSDASGYVFMFPFDNLMTRDTVVNPPVGYGDATLIAKDRTYAQQRADYYHGVLKANTMSPDAALKEIKADTRLGQPGIVNTNTSIRFVGFIANDATRPEVNVGSDAKDEVINLSGKKALGDVKVGKTVKIEGEPKSADDYQEAYYYFVLIDKPASSVSDSKKSFDNALSALSVSYRGLN